MNPFVDCWASSDSFFFMSNKWSTLKSFLCCRIRWNEFVFSLLLSHLVLKHRGNWVEKGNDKDLFDTFIQKMAKKDLNDIGVILTNLEMIYNGLPQYITLYQALIFFKAKSTAKRHNNSWQFKVNVLL